MHHYVEVEMEWMENKMFPGKLSPNEHYHATECLHWPVLDELRNSVQGLPSFIRFTPLIFMTIYIAAYFLNAWKL